ncbi:hypothetical protein WJX72_005169 [[Myrmecia] bisecta]|uniref:BPL/LPL catalytic domain-containing protein n=1 Tax=[Myrmecia] bisecta TaxID=41462 RepID=A0AAW1Q8W1_9CHLO
MAAITSQAPILFVSGKAAPVVDSARQLLDKEPLVLNKASADQQTASLVYTGDHKDKPNFDSQLYFSRLQTQKLGCVLLSAAQLPSTQTLLQENAVRIPDGAVCVADKQVSGKGRGQNVWESPPGCLMFSLSTRLALPGERLPFLQYVMSLAIVQAMRGAAQEQLQGEDIDVRIKWPNDIYSGGLKLGGILCHSTYRDKAFHCTVGVGLNISNATPTTCLNTLIAAKRGQQGDQAQQSAVRREEVLAGIMNRLEVLLDVLSRDGFGPLEDEYTSLWLHTKQEVSLEEPSDMGMQHISLTVQGLTSRGYLLAVDADGKQFELHPDGNSFDFFKGLVRRKVTL